MGQYRNATGAPDNIDRLLTGNTGFVHICRPSMAQVAVESIVDGRDITALQHDPGDMGPPHLAFANCRDNLIYCHVKAQLIEALDDGGVAVLPGLLQNLEHLIERDVIQIDTVTQDMKTTGKGQRRWGRSTQFNTGEKLQGFRDTDLQRLLGAVDGIVIGYGNGLKILSASRFEYFTGRKRTIRCRSMDMKVYPQMVITTQGLSPKPLLWIYIQCIGR